MSKRTPDFKRQPWLHALTARQALIIVMIITVVIVIVMIIIVFSQQDVGLLHTGCDGGTK
jgi:hypothetical protein